MYRPVYVNTTKNNSIPLWKAAITDTQVEEALEDQGLSLLYNMKTNIAIITPVAITTWMKIMELARRPFTL